MYYSDYKEYKPLHRRNRSEGDSFWPDNSPQAKSKDLADFEQRRRKGLVE